MVKKFVISTINAIFALPRVRYSFFGALYENALNGREKMLYRAMRYAKVSQLDGDYFEFGVAGGNMFVAAYHIAQRFLPAIRLIAFDSFQGLPKPSDSKEGTFKPFHEGDFAVSQERFVNNIRAKGVNMSQVQIIPGWFKDSLCEETKKTISSTSAAIVYIDCDLYESTQEALHFITSYLEDGTLILFDDWFTYRGRPDQGEQKAFREWLARHPEIFATEYFRFGWSGNSFIVNKK